MEASAYVMDRGQYEARCRDRMEQAYPDEPDRIERALARRYPATSDAVVNELQIRGLDTTPERLPELARNLGIEPRVIGRSNTWYPEDIDLIADALVSIGRLTHEAKWRRARNVTVAQQLHLEREVESRRLANMKLVADAAGVEIPDVNDLVSEKGLRDPLEWDDADFADVIALLVDQHEECAI